MTGKEFSGSIHDGAGGSESSESTGTDTAHALGDTTDDRFLRQVLADTLRYARERNYIGYDYFDGMSSLLLKAVPVENKWLNIAVQEGIKRAPVNIRPYMLVERRQSFKGSALFALANGAMYDFTGDELYYDQARRLGDWLIDHQSEGYSGFCGGHRHAMQQLDERRPAETPNVVPTSYGVKALLGIDALDDDADGTYAATARTASSFLFDDLEYTELDGGARIKYQPLFDGSFYTLNGGAVGARMLVDLYDRFGDERFRDGATKILDYLATKQTSIGGWKYRDPPSASHLSMDNHHNGFIIESYLQYHRTIDDRYTETLADAVPFYRNVLFDPDGAPNWDEEETYPRDIHAATQGIIVFSMAGEFAFARRIIDWTLANLYAGSGQFYYQRRRFYTKRFTLMRWCQAWMAYALSVYLSELYRSDTGPDPEVGR